MSAGHSAAGMARAHAAGRAQVQEIISGRALGQFLRKLDASKHDLSQFEMDFIESFLGDRATKDVELDHQWFTPKRRSVVNGMIQKYNVGNIQHSTLNVQPSTPAPIARAESGCCQYKVRGDGPQRECGDPGAYKGRSRPFLIYCKEHGEFVSRSFEVVALDGSGRSLKPLRLENRQAGGGL